MGKRAPQAPDPYATARAQGEINTQTATQQAGINADTARLNARMNRGDTVSPFGTVTNRDIGNDRYETTTTLSPGQQQLFDNEQRLSGETQRIALGQLPRMEQMLSSEVQTGDLPAWALDDADARDRATAGIMSRLEPQFARDREGLEGRLIAQGFMPGSEGYNRAADELNRAVTDTRMQAVTAGMGESRAAAGFNNSVRGGRLAERLQLRSQPINELSAIFGLGPGMRGPTQADLAGVNVGQTGINAPDLAGLIQTNYQQRSANVNASNAATAQMLGAAMGAAGSAAGGWMRSDRRFKRDIERIGTGAKGLPVYSFRYLDGDATQVGYMADEVELVSPHAVARDAAGFAWVDYGSVA